METDEMTITETLVFLDACIEAFEANNMEESEFLSSIKELINHLELKISDLGNILK